MMLTGELVSGETLLNFGQGPARPVGIDLAEQALEVDGPPVLVNNGRGRRDGQQRRLATVTGDRTVLAVRVVANGKK